jgi:hypothetical protein
MQAPRWVLVLIWRSKGGKNKLAAAVVSCWPLTALSVWNSGFGFT